MVFVCPRCGTARYAREGQKTAECFKCGYQIPLRYGKTRILTRTRDVSEALEAVRNYKMNPR